jgi:hypothetical protein
MLDLDYIKERCLLVDYRLVRTAISAALWPDDVSR